MKPEKLILSAFGSYAGRTEIDFTVPSGLIMLTWIPCGRFVLGAFA